MNEPHCTEKCKLESDDGNVWPGVIYLEIIFFDLTHDIYLTTFQTKNKKVLDTLYKFCSKYNGN